MVSDKEFEAVRKLSAERRAEYAIKKIAASETIWVLTDSEGDFRMMGDSDGNEYVAVWPAERYARACAKDSWKDAIPDSLSLEDMLLEFEGTGDQRMVVVFPDEDGRGSSGTVNQFLGLVIAYIDEWYGGYEGIRPPPPDGVSAVGTDLGVL